MEILVIESERMWSMQLTVTDTMEILVIESERMWSMQLTVTITISDRLVCMRQGSALLTATH